MHTTTQIEEPVCLTGQSLFYRRKDLESAVRLKIATIALFFQIHGTITGLSKRYSISRQFVYNLRKELRERLEGLFEPGVDQTDAKQAKRQLLRSILYLRLVGKCSLHAIAHLLSALNLGQVSTAYISKQLDECGSSLGHTLDYEGQVIVLSDEIFCPNPVLVTVEPQSMAILRIEEAMHLTKQAWKSHWQDLEQSGIQIEGFVNDEGTAMRQTQKESYADKPFQSDTFHAVAYQLGSIVARLEKQAYSAIAKEYERQDIWHRAIKKNHAAVQQRQQQAYLEACWTCQLALDKYELFVFLYRHMLEQFQVFDQQGNLRKASEAKDEIQTVLQCIRQLQIKGVDQMINAIENRLKENTLLSFLDKATEVFQHLSTVVSAYTLPFWALAWQSNKNYIKAKSQRRRQFAQKQYQWLIELLQQDCRQHGLNFKALCQLVFGQLDAIVQSSALVEAVNSIIRSYACLTRRQMSQSFLQLIMFFHNHRKFERGKRKGMAPIELLTGLKLEKGAIDLMIQAVGG